MLILFIILFSGVQFYYLLLILSLLFYLNLIIFIKQYILLIYFFIFCIGETVLGLTLLILMVRIDSNE